MIVTFPLLQDVIRSSSAAIMESVYQDIGSVMAMRTVQTIVTKRLTVVSFCDRVYKTA